MGALGYAEDGALGAMEAWGVVSRHRSSVRELRGSIYNILSSNGGNPPSTRRRSRLALSLCEREEISRGVAEGRSMREVASSIQNAPSTVSREIGRHGGRATYRASEADRRAWDHGRRPKPCRLAVQRRLQKLVAKKLSVNWSPEQISGWLKRRYPSTQGMQISQETIYRSLFVQARGELKKALVAHLRTRRMIRRSKQSRTRGQGRGQIIDAVTIRERPAEVEDRAVPGHWEGDLLSGSNHTHIATLVERLSRFTMLVKVQSKDWPCTCSRGFIVRQIRVETAISTGLMLYGPRSLRFRGDSS